MQKRFSHHAVAPILLIHGGAGSLPPVAERQARRCACVRTVLEQTWPALRGGQTAVDAAVQSVQRLEASPLFNAGLGAVLQSDGLARLSASVMDGARQKFSGVMLATHLIHPSRLALALQDKVQSVVGPLGAQLIARELGIPPENPATPCRARQWSEHLQEKDETAGPGTVGAVALDLAGHLAAATSTGGGWHNFPERISDSATAAGNYATAFAAISCTGIGEQIVDDGLAVRLETRVRDGISMVEASERALAEASERNRQYGWIGVDRNGAWVMCWTTEAMTCAMMSADRETAIVG